MWFLDFFRKEKDVIQAESIDLLSNSELQELIDNILSNVNSLVIKKAEWFLEKDWYQCNKEDFDFMKQQLEEKWLNIEYWVWQYIISRTIKSINWSITNILRQFEFTEK